MCKVIRLILVDCTSLGIRPALRGCERLNVVPLAGIRQQEVCVFSIENFLAVGSTRVERACSRVEAFPVAGKLDDLKSRRWRPPSGTLP